MYNNLEAELKRKRIRRVDLAHKLGIAISTVSEKLNGKSEISLSLAYKIKKILATEMPIEELFYTDEPKEPAA